MQVVLKPEDVGSIVDPQIRCLVEQRLANLAEQGFELSEVGEIWIIGNSDTLGDIETKLGVSFGAYELIEEYPNCFDATFVLGQSGTGIVLYVPKNADPELVSLCNQYAAPGAV